MRVGGTPSIVVMRCRSGGLYAQRMLIENALADAVRFFHLDALSSAVGLKVDFDMALLVIVSGLYRLLARKMRGYADAQARVIFRDLIDMPATVEITESEVQVRWIISRPTRPAAMYTASIVVPTCRSC